MVSNSGTKLNWAVIGGGNGGQTAAGHLAMMGYSVKLYDIFPETIKTIQQQGGISLQGALEGFGTIKGATTDIREALAGADIVMVITPAIAHKAVAKKCAPYLVDGQVVFLHPGSTGGALEFKKTLVDERCSARVTVAEAQSLIYACRSPRAGSVDVFGIKQSLMISALPATETDFVLDILSQPYPQMCAGTNVLQTSLENLNAMMHPAPTLLNASLIESGMEWSYYYDGITTSIGTFVEEMDKERIAIGEGLGIKLLSALEWYEIMYGVRESTLSATVRKNPAYARIQGQKTLSTRYLLEDIPMGLVPMAALARVAGVKAERMETVIKLGGYLLNQDFFTTGRNLTSLGLEGMSLKSIYRYLETGSR